jgi:enoyl-CoA hydratase
VSDEKRVVVAQDGPVVTITINREKALNALDPQTLDELQAAVRGLSAPGIAGAIVTGAGEKAFVAGADLKAMSAARSEGRGLLVARRGQAVLDELEAAPVPVVACVNGFALGGGLELALACHLRYATKNAKVGLPEVTLGLIPGYGGTQRLPRVVGRGLATEMILSGEPIDAAEAHRIGLVNKLFDSKADMLAAATKLIRTIGSRGPLAVRAALAAVGAGLESSLRAGQDVEAALFGSIVASQDAGEGIAAFLEKRAAAFKGN